MLETHHPTTRRFRRRTRRLLLPYRQLSPNDLPEQRSADSSPVKYLRGETWIPEKESKKGTDETLVFEDMPRVPTRLPNPPPEQ